MKVLARHDGFDNYKGGEALDADGISVLGQAKLRSLEYESPKLVMCC